MLVHNAVPRYHQCRLGLCCQFAHEPIKFRTTTAARLLRMIPSERAAQVAELCLANVRALYDALCYCAEHQIGAFRVASWLFPAATHPQVGYRLEDLPLADELHSALRSCRDFAIANNLRLTFHPDQFVVLNSPREEVVKNAVRDLEHHGRLAEWLGADVINIHAGGAYGDKQASLQRLAANLSQLSPAVRRRLTLENDDTTYSPAELIPWCRSAGLPLVYDAHHHRCLGDGWSVEDATTAAIATWDREPLFHISSPLASWGGPFPERHHDYVDQADFPPAWLSLPVTVEVEAKAKELAVRRLQDDLALWGQPTARLANQISKAKS